MSSYDLFFILGFLGIWSAQLYWNLLSIGSVAVYFRNRNNKILEGINQFTEWPTVTILIPAYNEAAVIANTLSAMEQLDYDQKKLQIIVVNDGSTDATKNIAEGFANQSRTIEVYNIPKDMGGKGKSRTLNNGLVKATGEIIVVYDADNTPESNCLKRLVYTLIKSPELVAVNGKVRTRNWNQSWLTRFIAIEFIFTQWVFQAGRWYWLNLSTLMGTNYAIWRNVLDTLGGFDENSLVDDTEMSLRIFAGEKKIRWVPYAVTWEQEPENFNVWLKQRTRWSQGNLYVLQKYLPVGLARPKSVGMEIFHSVFSYIIFLPALVFSHVIFYGGLLGLLNTSVKGPYSILWAMSFILFVLQSFFTLRVERAPSILYFYAVISYVTYIQLFIIVALRAVYLTIKDNLTGRGMNWEKTSRSDEND
ncbi:glycosyltransferase [Polycladidibacter stylochi]|uniref:glycosyltransferase n=1 Tax=Polycladidibacter stylochi TaxID=1807766 RepID=UPI000832C73B|nr:glycosyltransferase [Pseudovibrio stylochi]